MRNELWNASRLYVLNFGRLARIAPVLILTAMTGCSDDDMEAVGTGSGGAGMETSATQETVQSVRTIQVDFPLTDAQAVVVNSVDGSFADADIGGQAVASGIRGGVRAGVRGGIRGGVRAAPARQASAGLFVYRLEFDQPMGLAEGDHTLTVRLHDPTHPAEKDHLLWLEDGFKGTQNAEGNVTVPERETDSRFVFLPDADKDGVSNMVEDAVGTDLNDPNSKPTDDQIKTAFSTLTTKLGADTGTSVSVTPTLSKPTVTVSCTRDSDGKDCQAASPLKTTDAVTFEFSCTDRSHCSFWCGTDSDTCKTGWSPQGTETPCVAPLKRKAGHFPAGHCGLWVDAQDEFGNMGSLPGDGFYWFDVIE